MINKQRVQRIRGVIYTFILLLIFLPIFLTMFFSFRTMDLLTKLTAQLAQNPPAYSQQADPDAPEDVTPEWQSAESAPDISRPDAESESADEEQSRDNEDEADKGRYVQNTYLPKSHPTLYFDDIPEPTPLEDNTLYITLDNTPSDHADEILGVLAKHDVNATFFVWWNHYLGQENNDFYSRIVSEGHSIGIHSGSSEKTFSQLYSSVDSFLDEFSMIFDIIQTETGVSPRLYRLPGGSISPYNSERQRILKDIKTELDARGFVQFDWTASAQDAVSPSLSKEQILWNIRRSIGDGSRVVLLAHDGTGSGSTAEALDDLISQYKAEGFSFGVLENDSESVSFLR